METKDIEKVNELHHKAMEFAELGFFEEKKRGFLSYKHWRAQRSRETHRKSACW